MKASFRICSSIAILCGFALFANGIAAAGSADVLVRLKSSFLPSIAIVAPSVRLDDQFAKLYIRAAWYCPSGNDINFLAILSRKTAGDDDDDLLSEADCPKATSEISKVKRGDALEAVALIAVRPLEGGTGVAIKATDISTFAGSTLSQDELNRIRGGSIKFDRIQVPIRLNDATEQFDIIPTVSDGGLLLHLSYPALTHALSEASHPNDPTSQNNAVVSISTEAVQWAAQKFLATQTIPIRGSPFVLRSPRYETAKDEVKLSAIVDDTKLHLSLAATAFWRGPDLKLDSLEARSPRSCGNFLCKAKKAAEDAAGSVTATTVLAKYKGQPLSPDTRNSPISFELGGRKYAVKLIGRSVATATAEHLAIRGNLYIEVAP